MAPTASAQTRATACSICLSTCSTGHPDLADDGRGRDADVIEGDDREAAGQIDSLQGRLGQTRGTGRHEHLGVSGTGAACDQQMVGPSSRLDRSFDPVQHHLRSFDADVQTDVVEPVGRWRLTEAPGQDRRPGQDVPDHFLEPAVTGITEGGGDDVGGQQRPGCGVTAELVGHEGQVHESLSADGAPAEVLADEEGRPTQLGPTAPVVVVETDRVVPQPTELADRDQFAQEPRRRVPEELLIAVQRQQHERPFPTQSRRSIAGRTPLSPSSSAWPGRSLDRPYSTRNSYYLRPVRRCVASALCPPTARSSVRVPGSPPLPDATSGRWRHPSSTWAHGSSASEHRRCRPRGR